MSNIRKASFLSFHQEHLFVINISVNIAAVDDCSALLPIRIRARRALS